MSVQTGNQGPDGESQASPESFGDYEILNKIGQGGMGVVYKARQRSVNRIVALKMIRSGLWASDSDLQRFRLEAEAAARLQHPNIAAVYEAGECDDQLYYTMEYFEGDDLQDRFSGEPCPTSQAVRLVQKIAEGVHHAHQRGVLHRDLKPANILLDENDEPQITDFGLARITDADTGLTMTNTILGSPNYLAPEQTDGVRGSASALCDIYSLGAILYYLLTAKPPFQAASAVETIKKVSLEEPSAPSLENRGIPRDLDTICLKCLEKDPGKRYSSASNVAEELGRFLRNQPIQARPIGNAERLMRWCRRNPALASALAGMVLLLVIGVSGVTWQWRKAVSNEKRATTSERNAQRDARASRREAYTSNMRLAHQLHQDAHIRPFKKMLLEALPKPGQEDLRGFEWDYLYSLCHRDSRTITSSLLIVEEALPSPDGKTLAVGGHRGYRSSDNRSPDAKVDRKIEFWDLESGEALPPVQGSATSVYSGLAFSPDGEFLATANINDIEIWEVAGRKLKTTLPGHTDLVMSIAFSPDGTMVASGGYDQSVKIWDMTTSPPEPSHDLPAEEMSCVLGVTFSPDGKLVAGVGYDGFIRLWDPHSGLEGRQLEQPSEHFLKSVDFHPNSAEPLLASAGGDGNIQVWDYETGRLLNSWKGHSADIYGLEFFPDGETLVTGGWDNAVRLWNSRNGEQVGSLYGHEHYVRSTHVLPDGRGVVSASRDGKIKIWDLESAGITRILRSHATKTIGSRNVRGTQFSPDGTRLLSLTSSRAAVWDLTSGARLFSEEDGEQITNDISNDFKRLPAGVMDGRLRMLNIDGRHQDEAIPQSDSDPRRYAWSPDDRLVAYTAPDQGLQLFDAETGSPIRSLASHPTALTGIQFSPKGDLLLGSDLSGAMVIWEVSKGKRLRAFDTGDGPHRYYYYDTGAFSPDGQRIWTRTSSSSSKHCKLWDWDRENPHPILEGDRFMTFSPDGTLIGTSLVSKTGIVIYNSESLERRFVLKSNDGGTIRCMAFSPDSQRIVTGSHRRVQLWDARTGRELLSLRVLKDDIESVTFSPDGRTIAIGGGSIGAIHLLELPAKEEIGKWLQEDLESAQ